MFTYPSILGTRPAGLEDCVHPARDAAMKKSIYDIGLVVLGSALIIQSFWG